MEHNEPEVEYGRPFILFFILNTLFYAFNEFSYFNPIVIIIIGVIFAFFLGNKENTSNLNDNDLTIFLLYIVGILLNLSLNYFVLMSTMGETFEAPSIVFAVIFNIGLFPGYLMLKIYEHYKNKRLHNEYWENID